MKKQLEKQKKRLVLSEANEAESEVVSLLHISSDQELRQRIEKLMKRN